ncbi:MAG: sulfotransferase [Alphaproteobacteria bacterium]
MNRRERRQQQRRTRHGAGPGHAPPPVAEALAAAVRLHEEGRLAEAAAGYERVLAAQPDHAQALHNLGLIAHARGDCAAAAGLIGKAIAAGDAPAAYHANLGAVLRDRGETEAAVASYRRALDIDRDLAAAHNGLGGALEDGGRTADAVEAYRRAVALEPDYAEAHNNLGGALAEVGRLADAAAALRRAIALTPGYGEAHYNLSTITTYAAGDAQIALMEEVVSNSETSDDDAMRLSFALARAHDDTGDYARAFACLVEANRLKRRSIDFSITAAETAAERIIEAFPAALLGRAEGCDSELPVFIVGMPRSGTTLVEQILASHREVHGAGELPEVGRLAAGVARRRPGSATPFLDGVRETSPEGWRELGAAYVAAVGARSPSARRITDKMPDNHRWVGFIHLMLPKARIVHCTRDARDTCLSCFRSLFPDGQPFAYDLAELGRYYRLYERLMAHWNAALPGRILELRYEDVVVDLEGEARRLVDFCGLAWDDACLAFHETERPVHTTSAAQVRRPVYGTSVARWRRYERLLGPLLEALGDAGG